MGVRRFSLVIMKFCFLCFSFFVGIMIGSDSFLVLMFCDFLGKIRVGFREGRDVWRCVSGLLGLRTLVSVWFFL